MHIYTSGYVYLIFILSSCVSYKIYVPSKPVKCENDIILFEKLRNPKSSCASIIVLKPINATDIESEIVEHLARSSATITPYMTDFMVDLRDIQNILPYSFTGYDTEDVILVMKTYNKLLNFYHGRSSSRLLINPHARYVVILYEQCDHSKKRLKQNLLYIFRQVWKFDKVLNLEFVVLCRRRIIKCISDDIRFVTRFEAFTRSNRSEWGSLKIVDYREDRRAPAIKLNGYPLHISIFPSTMAILKKKKNESDPDEFEGLDMMYAQTIIDKLNFTPIYR